MKRVLRIPDYLEHMRDAIAKIPRYTEGMDWETFSTDPLTQDATIRNFEVWAKSRATSCAPIPNSSSVIQSFRSETLLGCAILSSTAIST